MWTSAQISLVSLVAVVICLVLISYLGVQLIRVRRQNQELRERVINNLLSPAYLSHEIRTPLTVIKGAAEILDSDDLGEVTEVQKKFIKTITQNSTAAIALAEDFLVLFKLEKYLSSLQIKKEELRCLVQETVYEFRIMHEGDIQLNNHGAPIFVNADGRLFRQVIWNLLTNSLCHGGPGTHIYIQVSAQDGIALIEVNDTGVGFKKNSFLNNLDLEIVPPEVDDDIPKAGSGIGMTVIERILQAHKSRFLIDTSVGAGARILIEMPLRGSNLDLSNISGSNNDNS
ncbi:MAG: hypothetical protein CSA83_00280 [Actinomycetales bacterium]|nr:MAG: hypothetical protein CSA83_00280 [Actinomycetales bacterium]